MAKVNIKKHIKQKELSYRELELLTNISRTTLGRIINNQKSPTLDQLEKIAIILEQKIDELYFSKYN